MTHTARRAFSLIEVLIAIVVLALGLLGLAAVFPAVVGQQRQAADAVAGVSMERSAADAIRQHGRLNERSVQDDPTAVANRRGWDVLIADPAWSPRDQWVLYPDTDATTPIQYLDDGRVVINLGGTPLFDIPAVSRVTPKVEPAGAAVDPRYAWDFVTRRVTAGTLLGTTAHLDDNVQVVAFARRIDAGIRRGVSLAARIRAGQVLPVAVDATTGVPTGDGKGVYSQVLRVRYQFVADPTRTARTVIELDADNTLGATLKPYAAQVGQKFVDQVGQVHTVRRVIVSTSPAALIAVLDTPVSPEVDQMTVDQGAPYPSMLFTPQVPVAVWVQTIDRGWKK
jgi:prepilin-type N-terminal cleavage/methylation domain-containing protein